MKKIQILGVALVALFAFSAISASLASAETTLLAEWLTGALGEKVTAELAAETSGTLKLSTLVIGINAVEIECVGAFAGTIGPNGTDKITALLNAAKEEISKTALSGLELVCKVLVSVNKECGTVGVATADLWALNMPWTTNLELMESGAFLDRIFAGTATKSTQPGYEVVCLEGGVAVSENTCHNNTSAEQKNVTGDVEGVFSAAVGTEKAECTTGEGDLTSTGGLTALVSGETLAIFSE
jgi:hypothetical protein